MLASHAAGAHPSPSPSEPPERERPRRFASRAAAAAFFLLAGAFLALTPGPAHAQTTTLVSNLGQSSIASTSVGLDSGIRFSQAQRFTTGNAGGYTLSEVVADIGSTPAAQPVVSIRTVNSSGSPGTVQYTLTNPASWGAGQQTWTAPSNATLDANTSYFVVFAAQEGSNDRYLVSTTTSNGEDAGAASGWSIADDRHQNLGAGWASSSSSVLIAVKGTTHHTPGKVTDVTVDEVTHNSIRLQWTKPSESSTRPITSFGIYTHNRNAADDGWDAQIWRHNPGAGATSHTVSGLPSNTRQQVWVFARAEQMGDTLYGASSDPVEFTTFADAAPGKPTAPTVTATSGSTTSLDVGWTAPANTGPPISGYDLQYRAGTSGDFTDGPQDVAATSTSTMIASLQAGTSYQVQVRASNAAGDGAWSDAGTGETAAAAANNAPVADAGDDQTAAEGATVTLDGTGSSDADSDALTYAWSQTSGTAAALSDTTAASPTFTAPELLADEDLVFSLTVNDGTADSAADTVTVTVTADDDPPTADAGADQTVAEGAAVTLAGSGSDPEGQTLTYAWAQTDATGTTVTLTNAATATASFTAPAGLAAETDLEFTLTVGDGTTDATDAQAVTVTLVAPAQVTDVTAVAGAERLTVRWTAAARATGYKVQWKSGGQDYNTGDRQATATGTSHAITGLTAGTEYTVQVTATRTGAADGPASTAARGTPTERAAGPSVTQFAFDTETTPDDGETFGPGETIRVAVTMSPQVAVAGTPRVALDIGGETRYAEFVPHGTGGSFLTGIEGLSGLYFDYTVQGGDRDDDGISVAADSLELNGGTIAARGGGAAANLDHAAIPADAARKVDGGPPGPSVTQFAFDTETTPADGDTFGAGETIRVSVTMSPQVAVTGTPRVALDIGGATRYAEFVPHGTGGSFLTGIEGLSGLYFDYTVQGGDRDDDGISVAANSLERNGGTITARDGGAFANLRHAAIPADAARKVDGGPVLGVPLAPDLSGVEVQVNGRTLTFRWHAPAADASRAAVTGYRVERSADGGAPWTAITPDLAADANPIFSEANVPRGTTRHYRVFALSAAGDSPASATVTGTVPASGGGDGGGEPGTTPPSGGGSGSGGGGGPSATVRILHAEPVVEGSPARFRITLDAPARRRLDLLASTTPGTASEGADYAGLRRHPVAVDPGESALWLEVVTRRDAEAEGDEAFTVTLSVAPGSAPARVVRHEARGTILDGPPPEAQVPLLLPASDPAGRQGFVRIINHSDAAGEVAVEAFDDAGRSAGTVTVPLPANGAAHFNSGDLEDGNPAKGIDAGVGPGLGSWRLAITSNLTFTALSYVRTRDGFLTSMHDAAPADGDRRQIAFFNPASNWRQVSRLRLVNPGPDDAQVTVTGTDDAGAAPAASVAVEVPAGATAMLTADELEVGLGDGAGKWRLEAESEGPVVAMSLLQSPAGHLTNLSTIPRRPEDGRHVVPFLPPASDPHGRQGFVRVANRSDQDGTATIRAFDDAGTDYGTLTLTLGAGRTTHFNTHDLEVGSPAKGLAGSTGPAVDGGWRLELASDLALDVLAYVRHPDGFVTAMHDVAPAGDDGPWVAFLNPASNWRQVSLLRLVNPGAEDARVTLTGTDDAGAPGASAVTLTVPAGTSRTISSVDLEEGADNLNGVLGDGRGKWRLRIASDEPVLAMSLLESPTGHLTNLSTAPLPSLGF